ncbi:MAG: HEAT repeat domain-containing protein [Planctomycetaceae bacterium]|nr:HEAT repeat domain-containing protein [Planctomycetaceae bacterium]
MSGPAPAPLLGPQGPFPHAPLADPLERRWLHYAFFTRDGRLSLVANIAWLGGGPDSPPLTTAVLLVHEAGVGWSCSQWNAVSERMPWSSFRHGGPREDLLALRSRRGVPAVDLQLRRTATPCSSQCATFHDEHWMRWQSEPGVLADGTWSVDGRPPVHASAVGYHERVRGRWGWPEMGGWVFGFCNDVGGAEEARLLVDVLAGKVAFQEAESARFFLRGAAVQAIGIIGDAGTVKHLRPLLESRGWEERAFATAALGYLAEPRAEERIAPRLSGIFRHHDYHLSLPLVRTVQGTL